MRISCASQQLVSMSSSVCSGWELIIMILGQHGERVWALSASSLELRVLTSGSYFGDDSETMAGLTSPGTLQDNNFSSMPHSPAL